LPSSVNMSARRVVAFMAVILGDPLPFWRGIKRQQPGPECPAS
jgi:hypothetical protein